MTVSELIQKLSIAECIRLLSGSRGLHSAVPKLYRLADYPTRGLRAHGIPPLRFTDGPKGINLGRATCFPVALARGASWEPGLETQIGAAMAREAAAQGANCIGSTCINVIRHPGWGRAQETYGADTKLLSEMGVALVRGIQSESVLAVVKHFATNSIENSRFRVNVAIDERTLQEQYLPHFKACVHAGAAGFMTAYNRVNGAYCGHHGRLLKEVLKGDWQFEGFVMSDFLLGIRSTGAMEAGVDLEMPQTWWFSSARIKRAIRAKRLTEQRVRDAATRVVGQLSRFGWLEGRPVPPTSVVACDEHRALALKSACRSIVLLQNQDDCLPMSLTTRIALLGPLQDRANLGSEGSVSVKPPSSVSLREGLRDHFGERRLDCYSGRRVSRAVACARGADVAVLAVGRRGRDEGEYFPMLGGGDRQRLELDADQEALIHAVAGAAKRTIVVLYGGSAIACGGWMHEVDAIVMAWYPGMAGGTALAHILSGEVNPSGRLPLTFPLHSADLPPFDPAADEVAYDPFHDYHWFDQSGAEVAFHFGFGLSYGRTTFQSLDAEVIEVGSDTPSDGRGLSLRIGVQNGGTRPVQELIQCYLHGPEAAGWPARKLLAFTRLALAPGERGDATLRVEARELMTFDVEGRRWKPLSGPCRVTAGPHAGHQPLDATVEL